MSLFASFDFADLVLLVVKFAFINKIVISPHIAVSYTIDLHFSGNASSKIKPVCVYHSYNQVQNYRSLSIILVQHQLTRRLYMGYGPRDGHWTRNFCLKRIDEYEYIFFFEITSLVIVIDTCFIKIYLDLKICIKDIYFLFFFSRWNLY